MELPYQMYEDVPWNYEIHPETLQFAFQPIWDIKNHSIYGYECLMRPNGRPPMDYIMAYERAGRLQEIEEISFYYGAKAFLDAKLEGMLFMNSFPSTCMSLERALEAEMMASGRLRDRMVIEILEYTQHDDFSWQIKKMAFERSGARPLYAIDDFGTGENEDLACLRRYKPDIVKIDRKFVNHIESNPEHQNVIEHMVAGGRRDGIKLLAEGVETANEYYYLMSKVDYMQGYFLGKPKIYK